MKAHDDNIPDPKELEKEIRQNRNAHGFAQKRRH
jgi:hypothetical protein